jgi:hypothetical protein
MRHKTPIFLREVPKCCHTCEKYNMSGKCLEFDMEPPEDFAATVGVCDKWEEELCPF